MSLHRFFLKDQVIADCLGEELALRLSDDDMKHAKVLRLHPGEHIAVVDASSDYFECEVVSFDDELMVKISTREAVSEPGCSVSLFQALPKGSKMDDIICHATEIGVSAYYPFSSKRTVVKLDENKAKKRVERWRAIAKSAAMQSGSMSVPEVYTPMDFATAVNALATFDLVLVFWEQAEGTCTLTQAIQNACKNKAQVRQVAVVVGSEGGFEEEEVQAFVSSNESSALVSLGSHILRCETAALIAPALTIYEMGGLGA